jgi:hypothetical protein
MNDDRMTRPFETVITEKTQGILLEERKID